MAGNHQHVPSLPLKRAAKREPIINSGRQLLLGKHDSWGTVTLTSQFHQSY